MSKVAVIKTSPETVINDYKRLLKLLDYEKHFPKEKDIILKLNLSWTKYFPACSTEPWQLEGVVKTLIDDGYGKNKIFPVENKTVVTNPRKGLVNNKWKPVLDKYGLSFSPLPGVKWVDYKFKSKFLILDKVLKGKGGLKIPEMFIGKQIIHLPTLKTHGHTTTTGAIKNSFGGLLQEHRHYAHKHIHEAMVDLMIAQKEIHPQILAVMDGTIAGNGAGPRTMMPVIANLILASFDSVAIDAVAAKIMGFDPLSINYLKICNDMGLGVADIKKIDIVGDDVSSINLGFETKRSFVIWGDQMLRRGHLRFLEKPFLHTPLMAWAPIASNIYHDWLWYPTVGKRRIKEFLNTNWGRLWLKY